MSTPDFTTGSEGSSPDIEIDRDDGSGNETEVMSEDDEGGLSPDLSVGTILADNPEISSSLDGFLNGKLKQSIETLASKSTASLYSDVAQKTKRRRSDDEVESLRAKKEQRTKKEQEALRSKLKSEYGGARNKKWKGTLGAGMGGTFAKGATTKRGGRSYDGDRAKQFLHQVCVRLYDYAKYEAASEATEVQALSVKGRIVFAANEDRGKTMLATFKKNNHDSLLGLLTEPPTKRQADHAQIEYARYQDNFNSHQIAVELAGDDAEYDPDGRVVHITENTTAEDEELLDGIFDSLMYGYSDAWTTGNVSQAVAWLRKDGTEGGVFWCDPSELGGKIHAEQALAIVLLRAYQREPAMITGTMRPCVGCYLTLLYGIREMEMKIPEPTNPGGFWGTTQLDGFISIIDERSLRFAEVHDAALDHFTGFVAKEFPKSTYATAFLEDQVGPTEKGPVTHFKRTMTRSASDFADMAKWAESQASSQPKKVASKKKAAPKKPAKKPVTKPVVVTKDESEDDTGESV